MVFVAPTLFSLLAVAKAGRQVPTKQTVREACDLARYLARYFVVDEPVGGLVDNRLGSNWNLGSFDQPRAPEWPVLLGQDRRDAKDSAEEPWNPLVHESTGGRADLCVA